MRVHKASGFTIIELLVVVSIIALLVGILLPAIGKAREQALYTQSQSNMRQMGTANATYGAEWQDRQVTFMKDDIASYDIGGSLEDAFAEYANQHAGEEHPFIILGQQSGTLTVWVTGPSPRRNAPLNFEGDYAGYGAFRQVNVKAFNNYLNGRFYDPVFYAPKDRTVLAVVEPLFEDPSEFPSPSLANPIAWSSYCWAASAMFSPDVFRKPAPSQHLWLSPMDLAGAYRSPTFSQALFPELKTHMFEHHWLQNATKDCNWLVQNGRYNGCEPYYFNHSIESSPVTLFYDGHVEPLGQRDAIQANARASANSFGGAGLWHKDTPLGGDYQSSCGSGIWGSNGYFMNIRTDWTCTSHNVLTFDGIRGRDRDSN